METYVGFDSAWTDNAKAPGAICAVAIENGRAARFHEPRPASFDQALAFVAGVRSDDDFALIALDQSTVVPNATGMRPVERVAASLISWLGGGVQPSHRGRRGMFCDDAPIWKFLIALGAKQDPEEARVATSGLYLQEVFPAIALPAFDRAFGERKSAPKYNPARKKTFRQADWHRVAEAAARQADALACDELAAWCRSAGANAQPRKCDQDKLDAAICTLIALHWRLRPREASVLLGDLTNGYMVLPAGQTVRDRLTKAARTRSVPIDGVIPPPTQPRRGPALGAGVRARG